MSRNIPSRIRSPNCLVLSDLHRNRFLRFQMCTVRMSSNPTPTRSCRQISMNCQTLGDGTEFHTLHPEGCERSYRCLEIGS